MSGGDYSRLSTSEEDPFNDVKEEVLLQLQSLGKNHQRWRELIVNPKSKKDDDEYPLLLRELQGLIQTISYDLVDLAETIRIVDSNRMKFKRVSDKELLSRKEFVDQTKRELEEMKREMNSPAAKAMTKKMNRGALLSNESDLQSRLDHEIEMDNQQFIQAQLKQNEEMTQEQEGYMDDIAKSLTTTEEIANQMGEELDRHNVLLNQLGDLADSTGSRMRKTMKDIDKFLEESSNTVSYSIVAVLLLVVFGLILAVVYL